MNDNKTVALTKQLVARPSITPNDDGCQELISGLLAKLGFTLRNMPFGQTSNLWASRGTGAPHFLFAGHTDVVPSGDPALWICDPFQPTIIDNKLYGRGVSDMKGGLAAMLVALEEYIIQNPQHLGTISLLITSDEEGPAHDGTKRVLEKLQQENIKIDYCIVGEPGSQELLADTLKLGARGSLTGTVIFTGKQGHVGYPHKANNPIHAALNALHSLTQIQWDEERDGFPTSSLQITNLKAGVGAENVIPETMYCQFNIRFSPTITAEQIKDKVTQTLNTQSLPFVIDWVQGGESFLSIKGKLTAVCIEAVQAITKRTPTFSNAGGTSDARYIVKTLCCETVELGLISTTIHAINEYATCSDLEDLTKIYKHILQHILR